MGEIIEMRRTSVRQVAVTQPKHRVPLREELRRTELVCALVDDCRRRMSAHPNLECRIVSMPKEAAVSDRSWTIEIVDETGRRHAFHHPVHSDDIDMFAGVVRSGLSRWIGIVERRRAMYTVAD
jgi:hypothetical protein